MRSQKRSRKARRARMINLMDDRGWWRLGPRGVYRHEMGLEQVGAGRHRAFKALLYMHLGLHAE